MINEDYLKVEELFRNFTAWRKNQEAEHLFDLGDIGGGLACAIDIQMIVDKEHILNSFLKEHREKEAAIVRLKDWSKVIMNTEL